MAADYETPETLIWFDQPFLRFRDIATFAPHFQHQLLDYFDRLDEYSSLYSLIHDPNTADFTGLTIGQPTSRFLNYQRRGGMMNSALPVNTPVDRIPELMIKMRERMAFLAPMIRERINIIGWHRANVFTGRRLFRCENIDDIRAVQVYRQLMPLNFPQICIIVDTTNDEAVKLDLIGRGVQFLVDLRFINVSLQFITD